MPDQYTLHVRPMTEADLSVAAYIGREAMDGLARSQGGDVAPWNPSEPIAFRHILDTDPGGAWIAELNGVAVGYSMALVRGDIWFLSQLFVQPDQHGHDIGTELLRRAQQYGHDRGARVFSVIASTSLAAHALYMRAGMFATGIAYRLSGPLEPLLALARAGAGTSEIADVSGWQERIGELDREVFGAERRQDHALYLRSDDASGAKGSFGLVRNGELLGYAYALANGMFIGPIAARAPEDQLPLLRMAAEWLLEHETSAGNMLVISHNQTLMRALLAAGWRSLRWTFLLTSEPFGKFDRYHPSGGTLL